MMTKPADPPDAAARAGGSRLASLPVLLLPSLLLALPVSLLVALRGFDGLYGQDAYAYWWYASGPLRESVLALRPLPPFFWPPGYPLLVALSSLVWGVRPLAGQGVSLLAGAAVPLLTALLSRELWPPAEGHTPWVPVLAGLLAAGMGQLWQSSAVVMSDTTGLAAATLGMWALARYGRARRGRWLLLAAAALAFAVLTRWAFALVALPAFLYALIVLASQPRREAAQHAVGAALAVVVVLTPVLLGVVQGTRVPGLAHTGFIGDLQVVTWNPLNALRRAFENTDGFLQYRLPNGLYYALAPAHRYFFTPLLAVFLLPGMWALWRGRSAARLILLLGWAGVVYAFLAGAPWQNFRFVLAFLPPLTILAAVGVGQVADWLPPRAGVLLAVLVGGGLMWMGANGWSLTESFVERKQANLRTVQWVEDTVEPDAVLFTFWITPTFQQYSPLETHDLYGLTAADVEALLADEPPAYLLLDLPNIETQWAGRAPEANYRWLERERGLVEVGQRPPFTLFRVLPKAPD